MGWFDEQIRQRKERDQEIFEESFVELAGAVLGKKATGQLNDERYMTKAAIGEILKYYHIKPREIPETIRDNDDQLEFLMRPHGIMRRNVQLDKGWYKDAYGPMLAFTKEDNKAVALIPNGLSGYYYKDFDSGKKISVDRKSAMNIERDALCFYQPFPMRRLTVADLFAYIRGTIQIGDLVLAAAAALMVSLIGMINPVVTAALTGRVYESGSSRLLVGIAVFMIATTLSSQMIEAAQSLLRSKILTKTSMSVQAATMMRIMSLPTTFFRRFGSGEISSRAQSISMLSDILLGSVLMTSLAAVMSCVYIFQLFAYASVLAVPSLMIILATVVLTVVSSLMQSRISRRKMELSAKRSGLTYAMITGVQKIKLAGAEKRAFARWAKEYSKSAKLEYDPPLFIKVNPVFTAALALTANVVLYYIAAKNNVSVSDYMAFNVAYGALMGAFSSVSYLSMTVAQIPSILKVAEPILDAEPEVADGKQVLTRLSGNIELNNVSFRYSPDMPYIINDLSLKIKAGEYVAIVGKTGCGKSTLVRLLLGFEKPEKGAVYYDGKDMNKIDLKSLRRKIGTVTQDGGLFQGDIFSNITISAPELTLEDAWRAAETAGIADDIRDMPMGMSTVISEGQGGISGGQKQRLMIARAVAPRPKILIFDEATSALDNKTQRQVSDALDALRCTRIVVAHRLSTIKSCDRILFLENGRIAEEGTYDELVELDGKFAQLVQRQRTDI